jgi:hypothetical protein
LTHLKADFETSFSLDGAQRLKPGAFKLWVNWIQLVQPHLDAVAPRRVRLQRVQRVHLVVAAQVGFESNF